MPFDVLLVDLLQPDQVLVLPLNYGCIVLRGLGQCIAVLDLADGSTIQRQLKLLLLMGKRAHGLSSWVVLAIELRENS
ncbi:hypothetical protein D3C76_1095620 [compost metagenome]